MFAWTIQPTDQSRLHQIKLCSSSCRTPPYEIFGDFIFPQLTDNNIFLFWDHIGNTFRKKKERMKQRESRNNGEKKLLKLHKKLN